MLTGAIAHDRLAVDVADAQSLKAQAANGDPKALRAAAQQFEAMMVTQMLKGMRQARFVAEEDDPFGSQSLKLYQDLLDQQWASRISQGKGLGYADMIVKALARTAMPPAEAQSSKAVNASPALTKV